MTTIETNDVNMKAVAGLANKIQEEPDVAATTWHSKVTWDGGFRSSASVREFAPVPSDEPEGLGGTDQAANPVEQLLSALGNCLAVGYAAAATGAGLTIEHLSIDLEGELNLKTFLGLDPEGHAGYSGIRAVVDIKTDGTEAQVAEIHSNVVGTSPVGHTLERPVPLAITLA